MIQRLTLCCLNGNITTSCQACQNVNSTTVAIGLSVPMLRLKKRILLGAVDMTMDGKQTVYSCLVTGSQQARFTTQICDFTLPGLSITWTHLHLVFL
jgi:hypothetical protein